MRSDLPSAHFIYTLCFLTRGDHILMLHRRRPPNQGLWNGVGGRIEAGEPPLAACLREVQEETGYRLATTRFDGLLSWSGHEFPDGGLYIYTAEAPEGEPRALRRGRAGLEAARVGLHIVRGRVESALRCPVDPGRSAAATLPLLVQQRADHASCR